MSLIPEAAGIKSIFVTSGSMAAEAARAMTALKHPTTDTVSPLLCAYIGFKYLLPGDVSPTEKLEDVGNRSLEFVRQNKEIFSIKDVSPHCGSASSATHKKVLLQIALRRELAIELPPRDCAECETVRDLAELVSRGLSRK